MPRGVPLNLFEVYLLSWMLHYPTTTCLDDDFNNLSEWYAVLKLGKRNRRDTSVFPESHHVHLPTILCSFSLFQLWSPSPDFCTISFLPICPHFHFCVSAAAFSFTDKSPTVAAGAHEKPLESQMVPIPIRRRIPPNGWILLISICTPAEPKWLYLEEGIQRRQSVNAKQFFVSRNRLGISIAIMLHRTIKRKLKQIKIHFTMRRQCRTGRKEDAVEFQMRKK